MGGGVLQYQKNLQYESLDKDLKKVKYVVFCPAINSGLVNVDILYKNVCKDISDYFLLTGVDAELVEASGMGGGGFESLIEIFKTFISTRDFILLITSTFYFLKHAHILDILNNGRKLRSKLEILLSIESNAKIELLASDDFSYVFNDKIINLIELSDGLIKEVASKYKYINLDLSVYSRLDKLDYSIKIFIPNEKRNEININRLIKLVSGLKVVSRTHTDIVFSRFWLIRKKIYRKNE